MIQFIFQIILITSRSKLLLLLSIMLESQQRVSCDQFIQLLQLSMFLMHIIFTFTIRICGFSNTHEHVGVVNFFYRLSGLCWPTRRRYASFYIDNNNYSCCIDIIIALGCCLAVPLMIHS